MNQPASLHLSSEQALQTLVEGFVLEHQAVMVLFTDASCRVADAVEPKLEHLARERFPRLHFTVVSRSDSPALTAQWGGGVYRLELFPWIRPTLIPGFCS
jgi:hypothetical protein